MMNMMLFVIVLLAFLLVEQQKKNTKNIFIFLIININIRTFFNYTRYSMF